MSTPIIIGILGIAIFLGHYLAGFFDRKGVPDVLGLMLIGMLVGPILGFIAPSQLGKFGPIFSNLVLVFILFESGIDLKFSDVKNSFNTAAGITAIGFLFTWISLTLMCYYFLNINLLSSLFIGSAMGGTSSAVVTGLVRKIAVRGNTKTILVMESAETDIFTLAIPISLLGLMESGNLEVGTLITSFLASLIVALIFGIGGGFLWALLISKIPTLKNTKFTTPAFVLMLYAIVEYLNFSGPLTALSFGIVIGNLDYIEPKFMDKFLPNRKEVLSSLERIFFGELVFLLRVFFFIYIGISMKLDALEILKYGAIMTAILYAVRILAVKLVIKKPLPTLDMATLSIMIPKGLGAAVIATLPFQRGLGDGTLIQSICFSIILFSTLFCVLLYFLIKNGYSMPFYKLIFKELPRKGKK